MLILIMDLIHTSFIYLQTQHLYHSFQMTLSNSKSVIVSSINFINPYLMDVKTLKHNNITSN